MELFTANTGWLLFTYIVGTGAGLYMGYRWQLHNVAESVIDSLIEQKYLKTRGVGQNVEILKHTEWCDDQNSK
jgi:hypothetical protein